MKVPFLDLNRQYGLMKEEIEDALAKALSHQKWILGNEVKELESKVASYVGVKHAAGVNSGTDALVIALRAIALKTKGKQYFDQDDEIIIPSFTFTATGEAVVRAGATPVFVDINPETFNLSSEEVKKAISRKTVGIIPVHLFGQMANMEEILKIARENSLFVVEDVAQAFGARWNSQVAGSIGDAGCHSFFPSKNLGGFGDGGMITTNDEEIASYAQWLRAHGGKNKYNVDYIGYNSRLDTIQAAVLLVRFKYVDRLIEKRRELASFYQKSFKDIEKIILPKVKEKAFHTYNQYTIRIPNGQRDFFKNILEEKGIPTMIYYPAPLHQMRVFKSLAKIVGDLKETEKAAKEVLSLPIEPLLSEEEKEIIVSAVKEASLKLS